MAMAMAVCNSRQRLAEVNPDGVKYFMEKLLLQVYEHFDHQELTDVTFKLSNPFALVTAHRLILSAASPYFRELFKTERGLCPLIEIAEIDSDTFDRLVTFCYTGKTLTTIENVDQMLKAAIILQLDDAIANCVVFIVNHITDYSLERAHALETETRNDLLSQKILDYEIRNFLKVIQSNEFLKYNAIKLQKILESDDLNVKCEKDVFEAVKLWYEHDVLERKQHLADLIGCLRLTQFNANFLLTHIQPLPGCELNALKALSWINTPLARSKLSLKYTKPRGGQSEVAEELLALDMNGSRKIIYQYNKTEDFWQKLYDIKLDPNCKVILMKKKIIFIGGYRNDKAIIEDVSSWNFKSKTLKRLPSMKEPRKFHSVVLLNDNIYAIGGTGKTFLKSAEMYSVSHGWQPIEDMIEARTQASAVTLNGKIYVMGGFNEKDLKSVECYDPETGFWTKCADMHNEHNCPGATVHKGQIFVAGGHEEERTVQRYDPHMNEWTKVCSLSIGRYFVGCISIYNQLWAIGGHNTDCVSVYDDQNDKWIEKNPMPSKGEYYCFTVPKALLQSDLQMGELNYNKFTFDIYFEFWSKTSLNAIK